MADDFDLHSVQIGKGQNLLVKALALALCRDAMIAEAPLPVIERGKRNAESCLYHFTSSCDSLNCRRPGKESQDGSRRSLIVTEIEMIGARVVEINGALYKPESEHLRVKVKIALRVRGNCSDMVKTDNGA